MITVSCHDLPLQASMVRNSCLHMHFRQDVPQHGSLVAQVHLIMQACCVVSKPASLQASKHASKQTSRQKQYARICGSKLGRHQARSVTDLNSIQRLQQKCMLQGWLMGSSSQATHHCRQPFQVCGHTQLPAHHISIMQNPVKAKTYLSNQ